VSVNVVELFRGGWGNLKSSVLSSKTWKGPQNPGVKLTAKSSDLSKKKKRERGKGEVERGSTISGGKGKAPNATSLTVQGVETTKKDETVEDIPCA